MAVGGLEGHSIMLDHRGRTGMEIAAQYKVRRGIKWVLRQIVSPCPACLDRTAPKGFFCAGGPPGCAAPLRAIGQKRCWMRSACKKKRLLRRNGCANVA